MATRFDQAARTLGLGLLLLVAGCSAFSSVGEVSGEVTLDDHPLPEGVVRFVPLDGATPTASALIANGKFQQQVPIGTHRVEISAPRLPKGIQSSQQLKRGTIDEGSALEELIPERYNAKSELKAEISRGTNQVQFKLFSK